MTDTNYETPRSLIAGIEIEAIVGGALMRIHLVPGTNPANVANVLRGLDPQAQFRDSFPTRGGGGGRPTLAARALVITAESRGDSVFIKITATNADGEDLTISVPKRKTATFLPDLEALEKLSEKTMGKLRGAIESKKAATAILPAAEQIGINYWVADDKAAYLDSMTADPPAGVTP